METRDGPDVVIDYGRIGSRAYPRRRVVRLQTRIVCEGTVSPLDRVTEVLECSHPGATYETCHPATLWEPTYRRCRLCASEEQRARAEQPAHRRQS
jgi:hypothetical protein